MARTNIRIADPNMTTDGVFFYTLSYTYNTLQVKVDDGTTAFSYPCDTPLDNTVNSLEWDGVYFWSLESKVGGGGLYIKKWAIDAYICKLISKFTLTNDATHTYDANDMAIEYYCLSVGNNGLDGINPPFTYGLADVEVSDNSVFSSGSIASFVRRNTPTSQRYSSTLSEHTVVDTVDGDGVTLHLTGTMSQGVYGDAGGFRGPSATFGAGEPTPPDLVYVTKAIWLINNYAPGGSTTGALYKISPINGSNIVQYTGAQYDNVKGASFYTIYNVAGSYPYKYNTTISSDDRFLILVKGTNLLFYDVTTLAVAKSLTLDGINKVAGGSWDVFDLAVAGYEPDITLYRLQIGTTYGNPLADESWTPYYSYEKTLLRRVVSAIAVTVTPPILPADGASQAQVEATVVDQYGEPVSGKSVTWAEDGATGSITGPNPSTTNVFGKAYTVYKAGTTEADVKITATVADGLV